MTIMRHVLLLLLLSGSASANPLPVKQERLGAWNYLYPLEFWPGGDARNSRSVSTPTALSFGAARERVAVIMPGSTKVAEFKAGVFDDLHLPEEWAPLSLAVNRGGALYCLVQHGEKFLREREEWKKRWVIGLGPDGWEAPAPVPYERCDRLEFDAQDRLWALGTDPRVGFLAQEKWTTFAYSDDRKLQFLPLRLAEDAAGRVVLFAHEEHPGDARETSHLIGVLAFADGRFLREPGTKTTAFSVAESRRYVELIGHPGFDRAHGYVCHTAARNTEYHGPHTTLRTGSHVLVSLGNSGLLWADAAELAAAPALAADEWEFLNDVSVPPVSDAAGNLWVGRGKRLLKIGPAGPEEVAGELATARGSTIDFDPLGRPWVMNWHGSSDGPVAIGDHGALRSYPDLATALRDEAAAFAPGRIFSFAIKAPAGLLAMGGPYFEAFTIIDAQGPHAFSPRQISQVPEQPSAGHGYNAFRNGEPWTDAVGHIHTQVDGVLHVYDPARRSWSPVKGSTAPVSALPPLPEEPRDFTGPFRGDLESANHHRIVFHGFHFFAVTETGAERQLDTGENPLAFYPFWSGWYRSPGQTVPLVDPTGRLWISSLGPYANHQQRFVLRKPAW